VYDVMRGGAKLGRIYLDMHPRDGKYKHAAQFPLRDGVRGVQLPEGVLVCNFPSGGSLMEHDDVVTMFHEFGHLMHHVLGGHQRWITQSGVTTEWDFVEAPSQMFEEWAWSYETLARFARHHETGEVIPKSLVEKMRRADKFGLGTTTVQQLFYAAISLGFHRSDAAGYTFWADRVLELDAFNPQLASRIARALDRWTQLAEPYRSAARAAIARVAASAKLSTDTTEIVSRALAAG